MKIQEAQQVYRTQIQTYQTQKAAIANQQKELQKTITEGGDTSIYAGEAAILQLTYDALDEKQSEYSDYMDQLSEQWNAVFNMETAKQQGEAAEEYGEEMSKIMEVARRIMKGATVPGTDEKKLMEFDHDLYLMAKQMGAMAQQRKKEKYESLWDDEEETEAPDPMETANNTEVAGSGPELVSAEDTIAAATASTEGGAV